MHSSVTLIISGTHWGLETCLLWVRFQVHSLCVVQTSVVWFEQKSAGGDASSGGVNASSTWYFHHRLSLCRRKSFFMSFSKVLRRLVCEFGELMKQVSLTSMNMLPDTWSILLLLLMLSKLQLP